jgi:glycerol-3-phosphate dehydrogenase (NAD+)
MSLFESVPFTDGPQSVAVIGAGSFGTAMAQVVAKCGHFARIYARKEEVVTSINENHINPHYLSEFTLSDKITATSNLEEALHGVSFAILAIPTQLIPNWLADHKDVISPELLLCNTAKGLYLEQNCLLSEAINRSLNRDQPYAILSGPSFAKEIMMNFPTAVVVASKYLYHAVQIQRVMTNLYFRIYATQDVIGVQLGGALKNPLAIGAGVIEGTGMGINTMAAYLTRSSLELQSLCKAMGGEPQTISGLSGVGDLMLTAFGDLSRNRSLGIRLSKGEKIEDITSHMTVEGVPTAKVAVEFARRCGLDLPIFNAVHLIISGSLKLEDAHLHLMGRPIGTEFKNWGQNSS